MTALTTTPLARSIDDHTDAMRLVTSIGGSKHLVHTAVLNGAPHSKARPRFSRNGNTYVPKTDRDAEARTAATLRMFFDEPFPGNVALACVFYRPNFQRIDVDNMLKHVCDAANKIIWADDSQVTALVGVAHLDVDDPRTVIAIAPHVSTLVRGTDADYPCVVCEKPISRLGQAGKYRKTCSKACRAQAMGHQLLDEPVPCAWCGQPFKRVSSYRKYCTTDCRAAAYRGVRKGLRKPPLLCSSCGAPLTHRRGGRCRDCWLNDPTGVHGPAAHPMLPIAGDVGMTPECRRLDHTACDGCACVCHADAATGARITITTLNPVPAAEPLTRAGTAPTSDTPFSQGEGKTGCPTPSVQGALL